MDTLDHGTFSILLTDIQEAMSGKAPKAKTGTPMHMKTVIKNMNSPELVGNGLKAKVHGDGSTTFTYSYKGIQNYGANKVPGPFIINLDQKSADAAAKKLEKGLKSKGYTILKSNVKAVTKNTRNGPESSYSISFHISHPDQPTDI